MCDSSKKCTRYGAFFIKTGCGGKSLGHKSTSATQVYSRLTVDPIRDSMQTATDKMLGFVVESGKN